VDEWWLYTALALVGETLDESGGEICGAVVSIRKAADRLALWVRSTDSAKVMEVGKRWKVALEVGDRTVVKFQCHDDALKSNSSFKNANLYEA
jgi:translation initiation factor 4E